MGLERPPLLRIPVIHMMATSSLVPRKLIAVMVPTLLLLSSLGAIAVGQRPDVFASPVIEMAPASDMSGAGYRYIDAFDWPMEGGGAGRWQFSQSSIPGDKERAWSGNLGAAFTAGPVVASNMLIVGLKGASELLALNASTGERVWNASLNGDPSTPAVRGNTLFVGSSKGTVYGINMTNGAELWNKTVSTAMLAPVLAFNQSVITSAKNGIVRVFDVWGTELWNVTNVTGVAGPATGSGQTVLVPVNDTLFAYNVTDGSAKWNITVAPAANISMSAVWQGENATGLADDRAIVTAENGNVHAIWLENGTTNWTIDVGAMMGIGSGIRFPPAVVPISL